MKIENKVKNLKTCNVDTFLSWDFNTLKSSKKRDTSKLENAIIKSGWSFPVIVWSNVDKPFVIDGTGRKQAVKNLIEKGYQIDEIPYVEIEAKDLNEAKSKALEVSSSFGEVTRESFIEFTKDIELDFATFEIEGMTADSFIESDENDDNVPETPKEPKSKLGDLYELGNHRVLCGDSTKIEDVERLMEGKKADMVFTDPPYGMFLDTDYTSLNSKLEFVVGKNLKSKTGNKYDKVIGDGDDFKDEFITTTLSIFNYCKEIFMWGGDYYAHLIPDRNKGSWIVWDKRLDESADKMYGSCYELCWSKSRHKREIARIKWAGVFGTEQEHDKKRVHPTQKPCLLAEWFYKRYAKDGGLIVDLFLGSGSTLIASEKTGHICYGMELDPKYVDVIIQRYVDYTGNENIKLNGKDIVWSKNTAKTI